MSYELMGWAVRQTTGSPTRKAVLLALADRANKDSGRCRPSVARIAADTELSEPTVKRALRDLVDAGFVERERRRRDDGTLGTYEYSFPARDHSEPAQPEPEITVTPSPEITVIPQNQVQPSEPGKALQTAREAAAPQTPRTVNRVATTPGERMMAQWVLDVWNEKAAQELRSDDWRSKIIMRIREYPTATIDDHALIIETALANPWWKGPPSPSVVYGNGAQFERSVMAVMAAITEGTDDERLARLVGEAMRRSA